VKLRLFPKIALILIALAILPAAIVGWQTAAVNREHLETDVLELHTNLAQSLSKRLDLYLTGLAQKTAAAVGSARSQGLVSAPNLQSLVNSNDDILSIAYVRSDGQELIKAAQAGLGASGLSRNPQDPVWVRFREKNAQPGKAVPVYGFYFEGDEPRLGLVFPFDESDAARGGFYVRVSLSRLWGEIAEEGAGIQNAGREIFVVDESGVVIAHSNNCSLRSREAVAQYPIVAEALRGQTVGSKIFRDGSGRRMIGAYARVQSSGWTAVIQQSERSAFSAVYEASRRAVQIVLIALLIAGLIAFFFAETLSRPIFALIEGARRVARRDFRSSVKVQSNDEMSDLAGIFNEMTRELQRYDELQVDRVLEEKTKTESVIHSITDGILLIETSGIVRLSNASAAGTLQLASGREAADGDWIGRNLFDGLPPDWTSAFRELSEQSVQGAVKELVLSRGTYEKYYRASSRRVHARSGKELGILIALQDVTLERQLNQLKETFLQSITHDLRNPMTSILGFLKFFVDGNAGPVTSEQREIFLTMQKAGTQLLGMINDILDIAKIEAGKMTVELEPVNLKSVVEEVVALYRPLAQRKMIRFELDLPERLEPLQGERKPLERVLGNLVANAIKFTFGEGVVRLELRDEADRVTVAVVDNGPGIPPEDLERIFDRFHQVKGQRAGGTGLGLTICKYYVELHRGGIRAVSDLGRGARFEFWIPKGLVPDGEGGVAVRSAG
jgi:NtrC-family two-component system sensor histidine kinase KinB